ncbi:uncharacterized protein HMPREF1541_10447 [Cyphellophora europaea CBS 101466]|nr:uncharacterized protein HMPREF1541_10447 [Cyphellophora europaea CBS 101466]ETN44777.1 hypothetical protein HMPREF1541_10447 [Cyphellophora europaea CBS 101466]
MKKRNLVNQRNFRSRRKQYVAELEQKLQQYEREGVAATRRVQHAARLVLAENAVLRHLIQSEFGLDSQALDDQIFREMRNRVDLNLHNLPSTDRQSTRSEELPSRGTTADYQQVSTAATTSPRLLETALPAMKSDRSHTLTSQDSSTMSDSRYGEQAEVVDATPVDAARLSANLALWNDHEEAAPLSNQEEPDVVEAAPGSKHMATTTKDTLSCEDAAAILGGFRAQASLELLREELGCTPASACNISHGALFEKMDSSI